MPPLNLSKGKRVGLQVQQMKPFLPQPNAHHSSREDSGYKDACKSGES